jgi:hypothetical protein
MRDLPMADYVADRVGAPEPTLSASIAHLLLARSPAHAWQAHPRLNPAWAPESNEAAEIGSAAHALIVGGEQRIRVIEADDYRTAAARAARDAALASGRVPVLRSRLADLDGMLQVFRRVQQQWEGDDPPPLEESEDAEREVTLVWIDDGRAWLKARPDWYHRQLFLVDEYKTTSDAGPAWARRTAWMSGYDLQAALYRRALGTRIVPTRVRWIVQETRPPYAVAMYEPSALALEYAHRRLDRAIALWRQCLSENCWPAYPTSVQVIDPPAWEVAQWEASLL